MTEIFKEDYSLFLEYLETLDLFYAKKILDDINSLNALNKNYPIPQWMITDFYKYKSLDIKPIRRNNN